MRILVIILLILAIILAIILAVLIKSTGEEVYYDGTYRDQNGDHIYYDKSIIEKKIFLSLHPKDAARTFKRLFRWK